MGREIISDDVNFAALGLLRHDLSQKGDKLGAGVARGGLCHHFTGACLQGPIE